MITGTSRAIGIDTSWYEQKIDPSKVTTIPDFLIARASYGIEGKNEYYADDTFAGFVTVARQLKVKLVGGYHYLSAADLTQQIDIFIKQMSASKPDFAAVDVECDYNINTQKSAWAVIDAVNKQLNLPCYLYLNGSGWKECFENIGGWNDYPLFWLAQPLEMVNDIIPDTMEPVLPKGRKTWSMWQYKFAASTLPYGIIATKEVDINVYNGDINKMYKDLGISTSNISIPTPTPTPITPTPATGLNFKVDIAKLNVRSGPATTYPVVDTVSLGDIEPALYLAGNDAWIMIGVNRWICIKQGATVYAELVK